MEMGLWWLPLALCWAPITSLPGTEFLTSFMQNNDEGSPLTPHLLLTPSSSSSSPSSSSPTIATITTLNGSITTTVSIGTNQLVPIRLPSTVELLGNQLAAKAVHIRATNPIVVVATSTKWLSVGATMVPPMAMLGHRYYVVTPDSTKRKGLKEMVVVTGHTITNVAIKANGMFSYRGRVYPPGAVLHLTLGPYHSFQLQTGADLTGTEVTSDNPIAVLSGHTCVKVHTGCDHVVEQLLPIDLWGRVFVVAPYPLQKEADLVYVVASERTSIGYHRGNRVANAVMGAGEVLRIKVGPGSPIHLNASTGVQLVFFFTGVKRGSMKQDPFIAIIPPVSTYCTSHKVITMANYENHMALMASHMDTRSMVVNQRVERTIPWQSIPSTDSYWATIAMGRREEIRTMEHPRTPFGLLVFGFQNYAGYGFSGLCDTAPPPPSCQDLTCKDKCEMVNGQPKCIQETFSTCWATGDPHYWTFDGHPFDFMGTCTYTLTKTCDPDPTIPIFSIEAKNEHRGNLKVSYVGSITIRVYGVTIVVVRSENGMVRVNNHRSHLPITLSNGKLHLHQRGRSMVLQTAFRLKVLYDWNSRVVLKLPSVLNGKVCGLCGNANGDPIDDALKPNGDTAQDEVELGTSWKVTNESRRCWDHCDGACGRCHRDEVAIYQNESWCGMMTQHMGPFHTCHDTIDPKVYMDNCIYDLCVNDGIHTLLCQALEAYADGCQEEGVTIGDWRTPAQCPLPCPTNSTYTLCGPPCPITCNPTPVPPNCDPTTCIETCECHEGFVLDLNTCIPQHECGCVFDGLLHGPNEVFWGDPNCTQRCHCDPLLHRALCQPSHCRDGEECRVEGGIQDCYPKTYGTCSTIGVTHYETFDGGNFTFQGSCVYQLVGVCGASQGLVDFQVLVQNGHGQDGLSSVAMVMVKVYGTTIAVKRDHHGRVMIDDLLINLPYNHGDKVSITRHGQAAVIETDFGLTITFDWLSQVLVSVPSTYSSSLCGLCGNYNGDSEDEEEMMKNSTYGAQWKVMDTPGCMELYGVECPHRGQEEDYEMSCRVLYEANGPFGACHAHVDATKYFLSCVHDSCLFPQWEELECPIIAQYAAACQAAGVPIGLWRTEDFCNISCPPRSHYDPCSYGCPPTCTSITTSIRCSMKTHCHEGCVCDQGLVLSGDECVPMSQCGCHHQGFYYRANETFYPSNEERCHCQAGGTIECQRISCPGGGDGQVINGVFQCQNTSCIGEGQVINGVFQCQNTSCIGDGQVINGVFQCQNTSCPGDGQVINGVFQCQNISCPGDGEGQVINGVFQCQNTSCPGDGQVINGVFQCQNTSCIGDGQVINGVFQCQNISCPGGGEGQVINGVFQCQNTSCPGGGQVINGVFQCQNTSCPGGGQVINGVFQCQNTSCIGDGQVINGVFQCQNTTPRTCMATGDHSYMSFDGLAFTMSGTCSYVLTETCSGDLDPFVVRIQKDVRRKKKVSGIHMVTIEVYGITVTMVQGRRSVLVDSISHHLPTILNHGQIQIHHHGMGILLQTSFGLMVLYDLLHHIMVTVPIGYRGHLCGLCGNYNGHEDDDLLLPNGLNAPNATAFGSAWKTIDDHCLDHCPHDQCPICMEEKVVALHRPNYCGLLVAPNGPFGSCHHLIDPHPYVQACVHDVCLADGDTDVLCRSIQSYSIACQEAGVTIGVWRRPSWCPLKCPTHSNYSLCPQSCPMSCWRPEDASRCPQGCMEGCQCDHGYLYDGDGCVLEEQCGCFVDGVYYKPYEEILKDRCHQRCTCVPGQGWTCSNHSCTEDETCGVKDGIMGCINQNPCKALGCRPKERCRLKDGHLQCVPSMVATCWAWGDPHYHTFDGLDYDFQGTCTYTMVETCGNDTSLVPFKVETKNNVRGGVRSVSYVSLVNVKVYGQRISMHQKEIGKVRLDGVTTLLPVSLESHKLRVYQSGLTAVLEADFGLRVTYDWTWRLLIDLPSSFYGLTCGLCGNFNLKPEDDVPDGGTSLTSVLDWARSWHVLSEDEDDPFCWHHCEGSCPLCQEEMKELYGGNHYCGLIKSLHGPFNGCHDVVPPQEFYRDCLYDVCMANGAKQILCPVLETYASICMRNGAMVKDWRTPSGCPLSCPIHSHYTPCGSPCPATCSDPDAPIGCPHPCIETCTCDHGHVLNGGQCIPMDQCGCIHNGRYHAPGHQFWVDDQCTSRCRCHPELAMVLCHEAQCKPMETCALVNGVRRCMATNRTVCMVNGDIHYTTFDGRRYDFMGSCGYRLVGLCSQDPTLVPFVVTVVNEDWGGPIGSYTKEVTIEVYNVSVGFSREHPKRVKVNGLLTDLPSRPTPTLYISLHGSYGSITTDFGLILTSDWLSLTRVFLPSPYSGAVCGLCGNANGDPIDDLLMPNGAIATNGTQFGDAWRVDPICPIGGSNEGGGCAIWDRRGYGGDKHCGVLLKKGGPLSQCHGPIDPVPYWEDCVYDACAYGGHREAVCGSIRAYVSACQSYGVDIGSWRTAAFCSPVCPPNEHYELCGPSCPPTCPIDSYGACAHPTPCIEGCYCDPGFIRSGPHCVPISHCGCWHHGLYYPYGAQWAQPHCTLWCRCLWGGVVECRPHKCGAEEVCEVRDGVLGCHPIACAQCEVYGGAYSSFDGRYGALWGSCRVVMLEVMGPIGPYRVEVAMGEGRIRNVVVEVNGVNVVMDGGRQWEVMVDGVQHHLPLVLSNGAITISQQGPHRILWTQWGPKVLFNGVSYILITLPTSLRPHGICGDLNGDPNDDPQVDVTCTPPLPHSCPIDSPGPCGVMEDPMGPFSGCHGVVRPHKYVMGCIEGQCMEPGGTTLCRSIEAYAAACEAAGGRPIDWRGAVDCPLPCPPHSHYSPCSCPIACASLPMGPTWTHKCFGGCQCGAGYLSSGSQCVPIEACGCLYRGQYIQITETIRSHDCSETCTCRGSGALHCRPTPCPYGHICTPINGTRACIEPPGRCSLTPASGSITFDGASIIPMLANGVYVVATVCEAMEPNWFRLLAVVEGGQRSPVMEGGQRSPAVVALYLYVRGAFVTVKRERKVWVNGIPTPIPTQVNGTPIPMEVNGIPTPIPMEVNGMLNITETNGTIRLQHILWDISLDPNGVVMVTKGLHGKLCGICGNSNGNAEDDVRGPDGTWLGNRDIGKGWRAPEFTHCCE